MKKQIRKIVKKEIEKIFENFEFVNDDEKFIPTTPIATTSGLALQVYENVRSKGWEVSSLDESGDDGSGKLKAQKLSQKTPQNFNEMKRLKAFFEKTQNKADVERKKHSIQQNQKGTKQEMSKSEVLLVWNLHGGDVCRDWVNNSMEDKHDSNKKTKERIRKLGGAGNNKGMGVFAPPKDPTNTRIHR